MAGTPGRFGATGTGGGNAATYATNTALFLKKFSGEVISKWEELNVMREFVTTRTIANGKSAQFPLMGDAVATIHMPGVNIIENPLTQKIQADERVINVDHKIIASTLVSDWDEAVNHYDVRSMYAAKLAQALAVSYDKLALIVGLLAARDTSGKAGHAGGSGTSTAGLSTNVGTLIDGIFAAAQRMDEVDVPREGRICVLRPAQYYRLIKDPQVTAVAIDGGAYEKSVLGSVATGTGGGVQYDRPQLGGAEYNNSVASYARGVIHQLAGFTIVKSNHLPSTNIANTDTFYGDGTGGAGTNMAGLSSSGNTYYGNFTQTVSLCFQKEAIGVVKLRDLMVEQEWKTEYQATLMLAKIIMGIGILRPECSYELKDSSL